jgi:hypothetical protein
MEGTDRISALREAHPWMSEENARYLILSRYWVFTRELNLAGDSLNQAMDNCVLIYRRLPEEDMRKNLMRCLLKFKQQST